jgi:hypothetical protein
VDLNILARGSLNSLVASEGGCGSNGPGSIPGGSGFFLSPSEFSPLRRDRGNSTAPSRGREYGGPALSYLRR